LQIDDVILLEVTVAAEDMPTYTCASGFNVEYVDSAHQDSSANMPLSMYAEGHDVLGDREGTIRQFGVPPSSFDDELNKLRDDQRDLESIRNLVLALLKRQ
jgi:hypothetical protein